MFGKCLEKIMRVNLHSIPLFKTNLSMATVKFRVRGNDKKKNTIYMYISAGRDKFFEVKTGLTIEHDDWNFKKGYPKQNDAQGKLVFERLKKLDYYIHSAIGEASLKGEQIDKAWVEMKIDECFNRVTPTDENLLTTNIQYILDNAHLKVLKGGKGIGLSESRIKGYRTFLNVIIRYEEYKKRAVVITNINKSFVDDFTKWMFDIERYAVATAGKVIDNIKAVCTEARKRGVPVNDFASRISTFTEADEDRYIITFNNSEQERIRETDMPTESLENIKKWILIGCQMGQRGGDLLNVDFKKHRKVDDTMVLDVYQKKGKKEVTVPIMNEYCSEIIKNNPPYPISVQKLNKYIKEVFRIAGFDEVTPGYKKSKKDGKIRKEFGHYPKWELVTTHSFRRSFATNWYKKMPTPVIMDITAHTRESLFLKYINVRVDKDDKARAFIEHSKNMN